MNKFINTTKKNTPGDEGCEELEAIPTRLNCGMLPTMHNNNNSMRTETAMKSI